MHADEMKSPAPINALRTRVIQLTATEFMPQISTDGLVWSDATKKPVPKGQAIYFAQNIVLASEKLPSVGKVIVGFN